MASLKLFDDYNHKGAERKSLREFLGHTWLRTLDERVQGVTIPDESEGEGDLRIFLEFCYPGETSVLLALTAFGLCGPHR